MTSFPAGLPAGLPTPFDPQASSFYEVLRRLAPDALPGGGPNAPVGEGLKRQMVEGTTVLALVHRDGVVVAGDRRATAGNMISRSDMRKVFPADEWSAVAISGVAGPAMELAKIFATELEHYEKVEGEPLSLEGKANKLAQMVRAHLPLAMQGMVVVPLFAGVDPRDPSVGRIYEYDPAGGRYRATDHAATGSGALTARATLKRLHRGSAGRDGAVRTAVEALFDSAEEDSATGGPDLIRHIYPIVATIGPDGYAELTDDEVAAEIQAVIGDRHTRREDQ